MKNKKIKHQNPGKQIKKNAATGIVNYKIGLFLIVLISFLAYLPVLHNGFINLDDNVYIQENHMLSSFNLKDIFSTYVAGNYHPLTILVYTIEYHLFELNAAGFHAVNLLIHLVNVILVCQVVLLLSENIEVALVASLLFGIHPIHVESVAWIAELKDLLYTFFFLASYIFYLRYIKEEKKKFYFYCIILFLLSLLSKAMAASLPVLLILTDYFKGRNLNIKTLLEKILLFALAVVFGVVAIFAQKSGGAIQDVDAFSLPQRIVFAGYGFVTYLLKIVFPHHLSAFYPYPISSGGDTPLIYYTYFVIFILLVAVILYSFRFSKKAAFGFGFFTITVLLVLQLLPVGGAIMADRYTYIPSIGIFYLIAEGCYSLWNNKNTSFNLRLPVAIVLIVTLIFFSVQTYARCGVWKNGMTFWNDVIKKEYTVSLAYNNRAALFMENNQYNEALDDYNNSVKYRPNYADALYNRGVLFSDLNQYNEALADFNKAIELKPDFANAYNGRGLLQSNNNKYTEALSDLNKALELNPKFSEAFNNRGNVYLNQQKNDLALNDYDKAIELDPKSAQAFNGRGVLLLRQNKYDSAANDFSKSIEVLPTYMQAYCNRAMAYHSSGKKDEACADLQKGMSLGSQQATELFSQWCH